jgi:hypothetical protein
MKCTLKNLERVVNFINDNHLDAYGDGADFAMFDDESELVGAVEYTLEQLDECMFMCNNCHEHFGREEMDFDTDADCDLCKNCNHKSFNDAPYGDE